jgi:hypothetical protein
MQDGHAEAMQTVPQHHSFAPAAAFVPSVGAPFVLCAAGSSAASSATLTLPTCAPCSHYYSCQAR